MEAIRTEDQLESTGIRTAVSASLERNFFNILAIELGLRHYNETTNTETLDAENVGPYKGTTGRIKFTGNLPWKGATTFAEYEQDLSNSDKQLLAIGGTVKVLPNTEMYARHEVISSLDVLYSMNTTEEINRTIFGISSSYMKDGSAFSEYRVDGGMSGRCEEMEGSLELLLQAQIFQGIHNETIQGQNPFFGTDQERIYP